jgi:uncharacterized protein YacL (UPF0231 family)
MSENKDIQKILDQEKTKSPINNIRCISKTIANSTRWLDAEYKKNTTDKATASKQNSEYKNNQKQKHLTGYEYKIITPEKNIIIEQSANEALRKVGVSITKKTGGMGYYYFRNGAEGYKPKTGNWVGYEFYKK